MWHYKYCDTKAEADAFVEEVEKNHGIANKPRYDEDGIWVVGYTYD